MLSTAFNRSSLEKVAKGFEKAKELAPQANIYFYAGHGADVCASDTNELMIREVPENCIYITLGVCGMTTTYNKKQYSLFKSKDEKHRKVIRKLFLKEKYLNYFASKIGVSPDTIHIHYPGMKYVVNNLLPLAVWNFPGSYNKLSASGVLEKSKMEENSTIDEKLRVNTGIKFDFEAHLPMNLKYDIYTKCMNEVFKSLPDYQEPQRGRITSATIRKNEREKQEFLELWNSTLKGVFEPLTRNERVVRMLLNGPGLYHGTGRYGWITGKDIDTHIANVTNGFSKSEIIDMYKSSVYPTQKEVGEILFSNFHDNILTFNKRNTGETDVQRFERKLFQEMGAKSRYDLYRNGDLPFTNTTIMQKFPGIHFNLLCRSVKDSCEPVAQTRRQESELSSALVKTIQTQGLPPRNILGNDYEYVLERVIDIESREYTDIRTKRLALYNSLSSIKDIISKLNNLERKEIISYLAYDDFVPENKSNLMPLQKKILFLLSPTEYPLQGGFTRKQRNYGRRTLKQSSKNKSSQQ